MSRAPHSHHRPLVMPLIIGCTLLGILFLASLPLANAQNLRSELKSSAICLRWISDLLLKDLPEKIQIEEIKNHAGIPAYSVFVIQESTNDPLEFSAVSPNGCRSTYDKKLDKNYIYRISDLVPKKTDLSYGKKSPKCSDSALDYLNTNYFENPVQTPGLLKKLIVCSQNKCPHAKEIIGNCRQLPAVRAFIPLRKLLEEAKLIKFTPGSNVNFDKPATKPAAATMD